MSITLIIHNLDELILQKLRFRAAANQTSLEAEASGILRLALEGDSGSPPPMTAQELNEHLKAVSGLWKDRGTTDELMKFTRGED